MTYEMCQVEEVKFNEYLTRKLVVNKNYIVVSRHWNVKHKPRPDNFHWKFLKGRQVRRPSAHKFLFKPKPQEEIKAMAKWKRVGNVRKSKDKDGNIIPDQFYIYVNNDVALKKGDRLSLFSVDKNRVQQAVQDGKLTSDQAEGILQNNVFDISMKLSD